MIQKINQTLKNTTYHHLLYMSLFIYVSNEQLKVQLRRLIKNLT